MHGLRVRSDLALPGWPRLERVGHPDLHIVRSPLTTPEFSATAYGARSLIDHGTLRVSITGVGRYQAAGGNAILVDPEPGAKAEDVQLYLTGAVLGAILHQRGLFPLHASCAAIDGRAVALSGPSGAGKSTLLATLVQRGARFISDDVGVLTELSDGDFGVQPSVRRTKLDRAALEAMGEAQASLAPAGGTRGKFLLPVGEQEDFATPVPLRRVYVLRDGEGHPRFERLQGLEAVTALVEEIYYLAYAAGLGQSARCFLRAGDVARKVQVVRLVRPKGLEHLPGILKLIYSDLDVP